MIYEYKEYIEHLKTVMFEQYKLDNDDQLNYEKCKVCAKNYQKYD